MADSRIRIIVEADDRASRTLKGVGDAMASMGSQANSVGGSLRNIFEFAAGDLVASGIRNIASSLVDLGGQALESYANLEGLHLSLQSMSALELVNTGFTDNMQAALAMSSERADELFGWIRKLAIESPFETQDVANAFRLAQAYGFTSEQTKRLTQATVDYGAQFNISGANLDRITRALGQMNARGKVSGQELMQLSEAGIGGLKILADTFGVTTAQMTEMVTAGIVPADVAIEALVQSMEHDAGGAAKRFSETFRGLLSSLSDLKEFALADFITGFADVVKPALADFVAALQSPEISAMLKSWGDQLGNSVAGGVQKIRDVIAGFRSGGATGLAQALQIPQPIITALTFAAQHVDILKGAILGLAGVLAAGAIVSGLTAVAGALAALVSPVGLITLGAMALGAAWTSNFGNIQGITASAWATVQPTLIQLGAWAQSTLPAAFAVMTSSVSSAWATTQSAITGALAVIQPALTQLSAWLSATLPASVSLFGLSSALVWTNFSTGVSSAWATAQVVFGQISTTVASVAATLATVFGPAVARLGESILGSFAGFSALGPQFTNLQTALLGLGTALGTLQPVVQGFGIAIAAVFGVGASLALNAFTAAFQILPQTVGVILDQITASITLISTTLTSTVGIVTSLLSGDFAGAWSNAQTLIQGFSTYATATFGNIALVGSLAFTALKSVLSSTFTDITSAIGLDTINTQLASVRQTITDFFTGADNVFSTAFSVIIDTPAWLATLTAWVWPDYTAWTWPDYTAWTWPDYNAWTWPDFPTPAWVTELLNWSPVVNVTGAISGAASSVGNTASDAYNYVAGLVTGNAAGTNSWVGGPTWVGEKGAELAQYPNGRWAWVGVGGPIIMDLPAGTKIFSHNESLKMTGGRMGAVAVGANAEGTTRAPSVWPGGGSQFADLTQAAQLGAKYIAQGGDSAGKKIAAAMKKATDELKNALSKVPGLFGASQVTQQQMDLAKLGVPQNFADDWLRRLTDEVVNGVDWEGVDIKDAALRAGIDPGLPAKAILELVKEKWNDSSFFAGGKNTDLINQGAVREALQRQADAKSGQQALYAMFGITPEQAQGQAVALGGTISAGLTQGMTGTGGQNVGTQLLTNMAAGITPEAVAPVATQITSGLVASMTQTNDKEKGQAGADFGAQIANAVVAQLTNSDALAGVGQTILQKIFGGLDTLTNVDIVAKVAGAMNLNLGTADAIQILQDVGKKIFKLVFQGYDAAASGADYVSPVKTGVANAEKANGTTTTTTVVSPGEGRSYGRSGGLMAAGAGGVNVNVYASVASQLDIVDVAYQVADIIQKRSRR